MQFYDRKENVQTENIQIGNMIIRSEPKVQRVKMSQLQSSRHNLEVQLG